MNTKAKILLTLTATLLCAAAAFGRGPGERPFGPRMAEILDLSEAQTAAIEALVEEHRDDLIGQRKEIMRLRNEKRGLMLQDEPDVGAIESLTRRIGELRTEQQVARTKMRFAVREQLTEEQRDKMLMCGPRGRDGRGFSRGECRPRGGMGRGWDDDRNDGNQGRRGRR